MEKTIRKYAYGIVRYNTKSGRRTVIKNNCSKDSFKRLARRAIERFDNFTYDSSNDTFVAGNLVFKYEWFPELDSSILN